jgi:hypothetical protein
MLTLHTERHRQRHGQSELIDGMLEPCFEMPSRIDMILARMHAVGYLRFLEDTWADRSALGRTHDALPLVWPVRDLRTGREPGHIDGRMSYYAMDAGYMGGTAT